MLDSGLKLELEALSARGITFISNEYLPEKELDYRFCSNCGYPTVNKNLCKFCKIMKG